MIAVSPSVQVVGCGDAFGSGGRFNTCFMVETSSGRALIDCGASSLIALKRLDIDPDSIDLIAITHLHGDHFGGLVFLLREATLLNCRTRPLTIVGPPGLRNRLSVALETFFPTAIVRGKTFNLAIHEIDAGAPHRFGPWQIVAFAADHLSGAPSYSIRLEVDGITVSYSGDTLWTDALFALARGADLLICEAYSWDKPLGRHLDYATVMKKLEGLGMRNLLLTHLGADILTRLSEITLPVAHDGLVVPLVVERVPR